MKTTKIVPTNFTIQCNKYLDQSVFATDAIDQFTIHGDGVPLFMLTYEQDLNREGNLTISVRCLADLNPWDLPSIEDGFGLSSYVYKQLIERLIERDGSFIGDMFLDDEGNVIHLPITFA